MAESNGEAVQVHGFLFGIEFEKGVQLGDVLNQIVEAVVAIEGVAAVEAEHLGILDLSEGLSQDGEGEEAVVSGPNFKEMN